MYFIVGILVLIGVYSMRWNVVIGGQLFSKSFSGFTSFKVGLIGLDGTLMAAFWLLTSIRDTCISFMVIASLENGGSGRISRSYDRNLIFRKFFSWFFPILNLFAMEDQENEMEKIEGRIKSIEVRLSSTGISIP